MKRLREVDHENGRLKKLVAQQAGMVRRVHSAPRSPWTGPAQRPSAADPADKHDG